ncbi:MAG: biotin--[Ruminococcus sp.]|nr:biotin--[acetyl-CoA-carboxylase] ligase [Ruminococcus sp.]
MKLNQKIISGYLKEKIHIFCYDETDSTNNAAKREAASLSYAPSLFVSERQTSGRGRRGRSFFSPNTGLYMTLMLPVEDPCGIQKITCAAAAATADAIESLTDLRADIKWVNDILVGGKKVAGILCELICDDENTPKAVIIGVGINLTTADFPPEFADKAGQIGDIDKNLLCARVVENLLSEFKGLEKNRFLKKYTERSIALGKTITFDQNGVTHTAKAVGIAPDGGLTVEENGKRQTLHSGEISIQLGIRNEK